MAAFIITLIISLIIFIASIFLTVILFKRNKKYKKEDKKIKENGKIISISRKRKRDNYLLLMSFGGIVISFIGILYTLYNSVPAPTIYPLDNDAKVYDGTAEVYIDSYPFIKTYYTLDGSRPESGNVYDGTFTVTKTTTVSAKNKFLIFWSGLSQNTFRFENAQNITVSSVNNNSNNHLTLEGFFIYVIIILFLVIGLVSEIRCKNN